MIWRRLLFECWLLVYESMFNRIALLRLSLWLRFRRQR